MRWRERRRRLARFASNSSASAVKKYISSYDWAMLYAGFYDKQKTLGWLEKAFAERNGRLVNIAVHPRFAFCARKRAFKICCVAWD